MEEALEILWTYARREPLDSNGETIVPTINNSIAAIRIIMRLEGWTMGSEKRKVNSEKRATRDLQRPIVGAKSARAEYVSNSPNITRPITTILNSPNPIPPNRNSFNHKMLNLKMLNLIGTITTMKIITITINTMTNIQMANCPTWANCHSPLHLLNTNTPNLIYLTTITPA